MTTTERADVMVIGAGIVGLAAAHAIQHSRPDGSIVVVDKEPAIASHQSGRNSGVTHAELYYAPGSLKARLSVGGGPRLLEFCAANDVATTQTGKIVLVTDQNQIPALDELERRASKSGVITERIGPAGIRDREPNATGVEALWVPSTGAVDSAWSRMQLRTS